jgi:hypothetical protein
VANQPLPPEILEPVRAQLGVTHRVLDVLVAEVVLQRAGIVSVVGKLEAAGMAKHVWMDGKRQSSSLPEPFDEVMKADGGHGPAALGDEHMGICAVLSPKLP